MNLGCQIKCFCGELELSLPDIVIIKKKTLKRLPTLKSILIFLGNSLLLIKLTISNYLSGCIRVFSIKH